MTEEQLFERVGRMQVRTEEQDAAYTALLRVLATVVSGQCDRSRVLVNLTDRTWVIAPPDCSPVMPCQVNGVPVCVVAPAAPEEAKA